MGEENGNWSKLDWLKTNQLSDARTGSLPASDESAHEPAAELRLPYRPKPGGTIVCLLLAGAMAWGMWEFAATNDRGLVVEGIFHVSPANATRIYQALAALVGVGVVLGVIFGVPRSFMRREIVLDYASITVPSNGLKLKQHRIEFAQITGMRLTKLHGQRFLKLIHSGGSRTINVNWLAGDGDLDAIRNCIRDFARDWERAGEERSRSL